MKYIISIVSLILTACSPAYAVNYLQVPTPRQHVANAPIAATASSTSAQLIAQNLSRTSLACTNTGTVDAYIAFGSNAAIIDGGIAIKPGVTWWMDDYLFTTQSVNAISDSSTTLACQEFN